MKSFVSMIRRAALPAAALTVLLLDIGAAHAAVLRRGPYLLVGTPTSVIVRWRTDVATNSRVIFGLDPGALTQVATVSTLTTEHEVVLQGLTPATRYYYGIGSLTELLPVSGGTPAFTTSPPTGSAPPMHFWAIGDAGTASSSQRAVRDAYTSFNGSRRTDLWFMLGDNAYSDGTDAEYQAAVFDMYPDTLRTTVLWPTLGNHDGHTADSQTQSGPYYDIFTLPRAGEAGGLPSGTEAYYSFDYGNVHFICLDSYDTDRSTSGAMMTWLREDLLSTTQTWIVAFWHHPPYSKGSHDSDSDGTMTQMRQNALPILEQGGVDLVLSGHSHSYERSFLLDRHYGTSGTLTQAMKLDGGNGRLDGTGAYTKTTPAPAPHEGSVYVVAGSSGGTGGGSLNHPAMYVSLNTLGSFVFDVNGLQLDAKFLDSTGVVRDYFTLIKGSTPPPPPAAPSGLGAGAVSSSRIDLSWQDNADNESGFRVERCAGSACTNFTQVATTSANVTGYPDTTLAASTTYRYRVVAYNAGGASSYSNVASATTAAPPPPPAAPSNLAATAASASRINLTWQDNANNESGFRIERCQGSACTNFAQIATAPADATTHADTSLAASTTYRYRVVAYNTGGASSYSNVADATTNAPPPPGSVLFQDDFEDGVEDGWSEHNGTWSVVTSGSKVYQQSSTSGDGIASAGDPIWGDYTVEARIKPVSFNAAGGFVRLIGRFRDVSNYYYLLLRSTQVLELKKLAGGTATTLTSKAYTVSPGTSYTLKLELVGTSLKAYVNGQLELSATDSQLNSGSIAVGTFNASGEVDDVMVRLPGSAPDTTPPAAPTGLRVTP
jgi:calcineurin-like phosphoesterase family protein/purple acid phosphatase-like protein/fibronectin type III domain protein